MLEPLPETIEALGELVSFDDPDLADVLSDLGRKATAIVPELLGLSLGLVQEGLHLHLGCLQQRAGQSGRRAVPG